MLGGVPGLCGSKGILFSVWDGDRGAPSSHDVSNKLAKSALISQITQASRVQNPPSTEPPRTRPDAPMPASLPCTPSHPGARNLLLREPTLAVPPPSHRLAHCEWPAPLAADPVTRADLCRLALLSGVWAEISQGLRCKRVVPAPVGGSASSERGPVSDLSPPTSGRRRACGVQP